MFWKPIPWIKTYGTIHSRTILLKQFRNGLFLKLILLELTFRTSHSNYFSLNSFRIKLFQKLIPDSKLAFETVHSKLFFKKSHLQIAKPSLNRTITPKSILKLLINHSYLRRLIINGRNNAMAAAINGMTSWRWQHNVYERCVGGGRVYRIPRDYNSLQGHF